MNKQELLNNYKRQEDKMLLAQVLDKIEQMGKSQKIESTDFLDMYQVSLVQNFLKKKGSLPWGLSKGINSYLWRAII